MAALPPFLAYIAHLHSQALSYDVPSPLLDVLIPLLSTLSRPSSHSHPRPLRLTALIEALTLAPIFKSSGMFNRMREQQDAQELWQLLMAAVEEEGEVIKKVGVKEGKEGFRGLMSLLADESSQEDSPFKGRLAYRRGCRICGYSEGIRLTAFDNLQLSVPRMVSQEDGTPFRVATRLTSVSSRSSRLPSPPSSTHTPPSTSSPMLSAGNAASFRPFGRSSETYLRLPFRRTRRTASPSPRRRRSGYARLGGIMNARSS